MFAPETTNRDLGSHLAYLVLVQVQLPGVPVEEVILGNEAIVIGVECLLEKRTPFIVVGAFTGFDLSK